VAWDCASRPGVAVEGNSYLRIPNILSLVIEKKWETAAATKPTYWPTGVLVSSPPLGDSSTPQPESSGQKQKATDVAARSLVRRHVRIRDFLLCSLYLRLAP